MPASRAAKTAAIIVGHGSRAKGFEAAMEKVARAIRSDGEYDAVVCAYLEIAKPSIPEAIETLAARGFSEIRVLPYFVQFGRHVREDIPAVVEWAREKFAGKCEVVLCPYLGFDDALVRLAQKRLGETA